jgi:2-C-methyl-D-erythritol 4-phosphate cytidylyltransferase
MGCDVNVVWFTTCPAFRLPKHHQAATEALACGAAIVAVPVKDTIKVCDENRRIVETPDRENLWQAQTPQAFRRELLVRAYKAAERDGHRGTDDASLVERLGYPVKVIPGTYDNIKITTPEDLLVAEHG